jgi:hypothetical protein
MRLGDEGKYQLAITSGRESARLLYNASTYEANSFTDLARHAFMAAFPRFEDGSGKIPRGSCGIGL